MAQRSLSLRGVGSDAGYGDVTPLHVAAERDDVAMLRTLVDNGMSPDVFCSCGTPLHAAARSGSIGSINVLLQAGAHIDAVCPEGLTPVLAAAVTGNAEAVSLLVLRGADLDLAFLPGTHMNLLHVCVEQDLVSACQTILQCDQGRALALCAGKAFKPVHSAALNSERESDVEILEMLMPYSGVDKHTSRIQLIQQAQRLAQGTTGSFHHSDPDPFVGLEPDAFSTPTATASVGVELQSQFFNGPVSAPPRLSFTPTANLDCSAADCSPSSRFDLSPTTPPTDSSRWPMNTPLQVGTGSGMQWDLSDCLRPSLRVKTRVAEPSLSSFNVSSQHGGGTSSQASSASAMMIRRMESSTPGCGSTATMRSCDDVSWAVAADGQRSSSSLRPVSHPFLSHV